MPPAAMHDQSQGLQNICDLRAIGIHVAGIWVGCGYLCVKVMGLDYAVVI